MNTSRGRLGGATMDGGLTRRRLSRWATPAIASLAASIAFVLGAWATVNADVQLPRPNEVVQLEQAGSGIAPEGTSENVSGRLENLVVGCSPSNAALYECGTGTSIAMRSLTPLDPSLFGREVSVEGYWTACSGGAGRYFVIESIVPTLCGAPTPTPAPTPITTRDNLAFRAPVTASGDVPGRIKEYLTDGDPVSEWHAPAADLMYASIDLGSERAFNSFVLRWGESYATRFAIYVWDTRMGEKGDWHRVHFVTSGRGGDEEITIARADSRYILIWMVDSSTPGDGFDLREWEVYGVDAPNMALGCAAHVSSAGAGFPGWHANDGNLGTQWASDVDIIPADRTPYIYVRCPTRIDFSTLRLFWDDDWWPRYYRVAFYQDGSLLPIWFSADNPDGGLDWFSLPSEISIDTVLVFVDVKRSGYRGVRLGEFELFGLPAFGMEDVDGASSVDVLERARHGGFTITGGNMNFGMGDAPGFDRVPGLETGSGSMFGPVSVPDFPRYVPGSAFDSGLGLGPDSFPAPGADLDAEFPTTPGGPSQRLSQQAP